MGIASGNNVTLNDTNALILGASQILFFINFFWSAFAGKKAGEKVERAMHEMKRGKLKSGRSGKKVKSRKQAIAIGLSEARKAGAKVPKKKRAAAKKR